MKQFLHLIATYTLLVGSFAVTGVNVAQAQSIHPPASSTHVHHQHCHAHLMQQRLEDRNPEIKARQRAVNDQLRQLIYNNPIQNPNAESPPVYTVPVVVHVVHFSGTPVGTNENLSDAMIQQGIADMNDAFRNISFYNPLTGADVEIEFCLASQDPSGNFTTGITRTASNAYTDLDSDTEDADLKSIIAPQWNPLNYCNIWLVDEICSSVSGGCGTAGYAYLAGAHGAAVDGIVNEARWFGSSQNNSKVHIHEMGHYLNLSHTFDGCTNNDCTTDGDQVCDTPPDNATTAVTCGNTVNSCTTDEDDISANNPFRPVGLGGLGDQNDMYENYMDYGFQACQDRFTEGQKTRMRTALTVTRATLLSSPGCVNPSNPEIYFNVTANSVSETNTSGGSNCTAFRDVTITMNIAAAPTGDADVTINYAGTATGGGVDYTEGTAPEVTFLDGSTASQTFTIRIWDDATIEGEETIELSFSISGTTNAVASSFNQTMTLTILDDDELPENATTNYLLNEDFSGGIPGTWGYGSFGGSGTIIWEAGTAGLPGTSVYVSDDNGATRGDDFTVTRRFAVITPSLNATAVAQTITLEMDLDVDGSANDFFEIFYNAGAGWFIFQSPINSFSGTYSVSLPAAVQGNNFQLAFVWNNNGDGAMTGDVPSFDNVKVFYGTSAAAVETAISSVDVPFGPFDTVYVYNGVDKDIVARVINQSAWDYGCTSFQIDRTGTSAQMYTNPSVSSFVTDKTLLVTPTNNNPTGSYNIRMYFTAAEVAGWEAVTGESRNNLTLFKAANAISSGTGATELGSNSANAVYEGTEHYVEADFSTGFSGFAAHSNTTTPLPIELVSFDGELRNKAIHLSWQTATEIDNDYFSIERSRDGVSFEPIGEVQGSGTTIDSRFYTFIDEEPAYGKNYYRLKQTDYDDSYSYADQVVVIEYQQKAIVRIEPNPVQNNQLQLYYSSYNDANTVQIEIRAVDGRLIYSQQQSLNNGMNKFSMDISDLGNGVYILRTIKDDSMHNIRFVKE